MEFTITPAAEHFIRRMLRLVGEGGYGFRLSVTAGGCSGLSASFSIEKNPMPGDAVHERDGMKLFLPAESRMLLEGVTLDFADTPTETGLIVRDPKAAACGCGSSQGASPPGVASIDVSSIGRRH
jgi:iron-sulfur cluster assembly protein